jgi:uncharacterized membrane protein YkvA (DUF1232 family)
VKGIAENMGSISEVISRGRLVWRLLNDYRVPAWIKISIPLVVLLYFITPIDFIPDFIPVLGQLDDLGILLLGMSLIIRLAPQNVVDEHRLALGYDADVPPTSTSGKTARKSSAGDETIEGEYKVVRPRDNK